AAARDPALDGLQESARGRGRPGVSLDGSHRACALGRRDLRALVGLDLLQNIGHCAFDTAIRRSSRPSASPLSTDFAASAMPSFRSLARPATISAAAAFKSATSRNALLRPLS